MSNPATSSLEHEITPYHAANSESACHSLSGHLADVLDRAQPRLTRFAHAQGIAPDAVEDVVQETLFEAWQHLKQLRAPERFDSWLNGICYNICRRWLRNQGIRELRQSTFTGLQAEDLAEPLDFPDPQALDPAEELSRQDLSTLLDRAMGHLPQGTRDALVMHYIAGLPQIEVAQRLGISINALEVKLHRARRQLRQVLSGALRTEAEAFGLLLTEEEVMNWQQTRLWCWRCGKHRVLGMFERMPWGQTRLRLRCPQCDKLYNGRERAGTILAPGRNALDGLHSFRPALRRVLQAEGAESDWTVARMINEHRCSCQTPIHFRTVNCETPCEPPFQYRFLPPACTYLRIACPKCGVSLIDLGSVVFTHPAVRSFLWEHPRVLWGPDILVSYAGQDAISWRLLDLSTNEHLTMLAHPETLQVLAALQS